MTKQDNAKPQASAAPVGAAAPPSAPGPAPSSGPAAAVPVQDREAPREAKSRDGLIVASIVIVSAAIAVMCRSQLSLSIPISGAFGIVTLAFLMLLHKQTQKSAQIERLKAELAQSRQGMKARSIPRAAPASSITITTEARIRELSRDIGNLTPRPEEGQPAGPLPEPPVAGPVAPERAPPRMPLRAPAKPAAEAPADAPPAPAPAAMAGPDIPVAGFGAPQAEQPIREQWAFRPRTDARASVQEASAATSAANSNVQGPPAPVATTIEGDLELVQRKIKELADEVNAAEALRPRQPLTAVRTQGPSSPLEESIGALKAAAKSMRGRPSLGDFIPKFEAQAFNPQPPPPPAPPLVSPTGGLQELVIPVTAERIAGSDSAPAAPDLGERSGDRDVAPPSLELPLPEFNAAPVPTLPPRAAALARAVEADAMDILLGPIVTLAEHSVGHYEMTANLRSPEGDPLDFDEDVFALIGGELDSQFDVARLNRASALAARMDAREREGLLLAEFLGSSMSSRAFLETFAAVYEARQRIAGQLVMTFSQRAVDEFSPAAWQAIRDMHAFGFRFALDKVRHMGTDFAALQRSGFRFVRFEAQALLDGIATPERFVAAEEILQRATLAGLSIIATGIQDAGTQKQLLDAGVLLGQGPLFGAPRQINVDGSAGPSDQSAAA